MTDATGEPVISDNGKTITLGPLVAFYDDGETMLTYLFPIYATRIASNPVCPPDFGARIERERRAPCWRVYKTQDILARGKYKYIETVDGADACRAALKTLAAKAGDDGELLIGPRGNVMKLGRFIAQCPSMIVPGMSEEECLPAQLLQMFDHEFGKDELAWNIRDMTIPDRPTDAEPLETVYARAPQECIRVMQAHLAAAQANSAAAPAAEIREP